MISKGNCDSNDDRSSYDLSHPRALFRVQTCTMPYARQRARQKKTKPWSGASSSRKTKHTLFNSRTSSGKVSLPQTSQFAQQYEEGHNSRGLPTDICANHAQSPNKSNGHVVAFAYLRHIEQATWLPATTILGKINLYNEETDHHDMPFKKAPCKI